MLCVEQAGLSPTPYTSLDHGHPLPGGGDGGGDHHVARRLFVHLDVLLHWLGSVRVDEGGDSGHGLSVFNGQLPQNCGVGPGDRPAVPFHVVFHRSLQLTTSRCVQQHT